MIESLQFEFNRRDQHLGNRADSVDISSNISLADVNQQIPERGLAFEKLEVGQLHVNQYISGGTNIYNTGTGFWLGDNAGVWMLSIGDATANFLTWDGVTLTIAGTLTVGTIPNLPSDTDLVGSWNFDEGGGSTALDQTPNRNNGTITTATYTTGISGSSLLFDGADSRVVVTSNAAFDNIWDGGGSISVWIYPASDGESDAGRIIQRDDGGNGWAIVTNLQSGSNVSVSFYSRWSTGIGNWSTSTAVVPINTWSHIVVLYNADSATNDPSIYLNGELQTITENTAPSGARLTDAGLNLRFGDDYANTASFDGRIDEIRMYGSTITLNNIKALFTNTTGTSTGGVLQTGGIYRTSSGSAGRIELDPTNGLRVFNALNANTIRLLIDGSATFAGGQVTIDTSGNVTVNTISATAGTIAAFTISGSEIAATNLSLVSGASNTARITVGTGSDLAGMNSGAIGSDIAFWAGDTHANRATAPFRVDLNGNVTATSITSANVTTTFQLGGATMTSTAAELNVLDGINSDVTTANISRLATMQSTPLFFALDEQPLNDLFSESANFQTYTDDADYFVYRASSTVFAVYDATAGGDGENRDVTSDWATATDIIGAAKIGSFLYVCLFDGGANDNAVYRYAAQDIAAGGTLMTEAGTALGSAVRAFMVSDGTDLFFANTGGDTVATQHIFRQYTISGTTITSSSTITCGATSANFAYRVMDRQGNFYGFNTGDNFFRRYDSSGTLQATQTRAMVAGAVDTVMSIRGVPYWLSHDTVNLVVKGHKIPLLPSDIYS